MIESKKVLYSKGNSDEQYTPAYAVEPILEFIPEGAIVWCPFDTEESEFVKQISKTNKVIFSHIKNLGKLKSLRWQKELPKITILDLHFQHKLLGAQNLGTNNIGGGKDFFEFEPEEWDIIISNPPFSNKRLFFKRALSFGKPFALIMTNTWLNDSAPKQLFKDKDLQLLMFDKRMKFVNPDGRANNKITFSSSYYCWNFLPKQIIMKELNVPK